MRLVLTLLLLFAVAVPALLMLFSEGRGLAARILWALVIAVTPFVMTALIQMSPELNGEAHHAARAWRLLGVALSAACFVLPWCLYAFATRR